MTISDYGRLDGVGLAKLVADRAVTPSELLEAAVARAERFNPALNAIVFKDYERARALAAEPLPQGAFTGVPFLLKDISLQYTGTPTRQGSRLWPPIPADHDSFLMTRFRNAGLVPFGKTNVPEFGLVPVTEGKLYGAAHNPFSLAHSPGGSSGGSAAAVAAGIVPIAHANDAGGSIRIPASCCGLVGLKPTRGRVSAGPDQPDGVDGLSAELVVTRSVRDTAAVLDAAAGNEPGDPYSAPPQASSYLLAAAQEPKTLRVAFSTRRPDGTKVHSDCIAAVEKTAMLLSELGHRVEEGAPEIDVELVDPAFSVLWTANLASLIDYLHHVLGQTPGPDTLEGLTLAYYEMGKRTSGPQYVQAKMILNRLTRTIGRFHARYDVWLTPTLGEPPWEIGHLDMDRRDAGRVMEELSHYVPFTPIQNITGQPAINLPLYWNDAGLPIGVQFAGAFGDEVTLLQLATQIERAEPWAKRYETIAL